MTPSAAFTQNLSERPSKVVIKYGVYDRIERAVAVAEPEEHFEQGLWDEVGAEHGGERVREEEREPAENKHPHDHGQNKGEAPLSGLPLLPAAHSLTRLHRRLSRLHLSNFGGPHLFHPRAEDVVVPIGRGAILLHLQPVALSIATSFHLRCCSVFFLRVARVALLSLSLTWWLSCSFLGNEVDSDIHQNHDEARSEERSSAGEYDVPLLVVYFAFGTVLLAGLLHCDEGGE